MAQLSPMQRQSQQSPKTPKAQTSPMQRYSPKTQTSPMQRYHQSPKTTPTAQTSPTFEQLLHGGNSQAPYSDLSNSTPISARNLDMEEDFTPHSHIKKSVLSKMRDKVKKIRHNLRAKQMYEYPYYGNTTPSWGVTLDDEDEDEEEEDEDPEYLGAPKLAPESYKETARQHPRADPVVSEKRAVPNMVARHKPEEDDKNTPHSKTITETVSEKLAPAYAAVSDVTHTIASSIVNLKISSSSSFSSPKDQESHKDIPVSVSPSAGALQLHSKQQSLNQEQQSAVLSRDQSIKSPGESDKGVSVKEYVMHKLEPGDDEKALSKVVCDALSPTTKKPQGENSNFTGGVVGKVREVVTSLLRDVEEPSHGVQSNNNNFNNNLSTDIQKVSANPNVSLQHSISAPSTNLPPRTANASSPIPVSTNPHQVTIVAEEENLGRILQAN